MMSTIHQRHVLALFEEKKMLSFSELKSQFIETKEMNQTTLYRILERFLETGIIHRTEFGKEKYFCLCRCQNGNKGIKIQFCTNCHSITEDHFPTDTNSIRVENTEYLKRCHQCP